MPGRTKPRSLRAEALGRDRRHAPHRVLKREPVVFAPQPAGHARESAVGARMRFGARSRQAVGTHHVQAVGAGGVQIVIVEAGT